MEKKRSDEQKQVGNLFLEIVPLWLVLLKRYEGSGWWSSWKASAETKQIIPLGIRSATVTRSG